MIDWMGVGYVNLDGTRKVSGGAKSGRIYRVAGGEDGNAAPEWSAFVYRADEGWEGQATLIAEAVPREEAEGACYRHETRLCVAEARSFVGEALAFRGRAPFEASGDGDAWRVEVASLIDAAGRIDLEVPGVRAALEAVVALAAAKPADVLAAEDFIERVRTGTQRRKAMADLAETQTQRRSLGQGFRAQGL